MDNKSRMKGDFHVRFCEKLEVKSLGLTRQQILVRMTEDEEEKFEKRLAKSKLNKNDFCIKCLLNHPINVIEEMPELIRQLKAIGNNLNQITRSANAGISTPPPVVEEVKKGVDDLWRLLRRLKGEKP